VPIAVLVSAAIVAGSLYRVIRVYRSTKAQPLANLVAAVF